MDFLNGRVSGKGKLMAKPSAVSLAKLGCSTRGARAATVAHAVARYFPAPVAIVKIQVDVMPAVNVSLAAARPI